MKKILKKLEMHNFLNTLHKYEFDFIIKNKSHILNKNAVVRKLY